MKNLFYNLLLLLFGFIQTYVAYSAIGMIFMVDENSLPLLIILWVVLVGLALLDKPIRGIQGWPQVLLCLIVSPLRGLIQLVIVIITIVNLCRRSGPVCERGRYDDDNFLSTVVYIATGVYFVSKRQRTKNAAKHAEIAARQKAKSERTSQKRSARNALLAKYPDYFQLEEMLRKARIITGHLSTGYAGITDENCDISYNDTYTEMQISYTAVVYPKGDEKEVKAAYKHYAAACQDLQAKAENLAVSDIKSYINKFPFRGTVKWKVYIKIDDYKFRI